MVLLPEREVTAPDQHTVGGLAGRLQEQSAVAGRAAVHADGQTGRGSRRQQLHETLGVALPQQVMDAGVDHALHVGVEVVADRHRRVVDQFESKTAGRLDEPLCGDDRDGEVHEERARRTDPHRLAIGHPAKGAHVGDLVGQRRRLEGARRGCAAGRMHQRREVHQITAGLSQQLDALIVEQRVASHEGEDVPGAGLGQRGLVAEQTGVQRHHLDGASGQAASGVDRLRPSLHGAVHRAGTAVRYSPGLHVGDDADP